ncbi:MAG: potassium transporter TrkG [Actinomycetota bacterium]|nr:potassium transporter TrkG [Actinomycetota bacterium]
MPSKLSNSSRKNIAFSAGISLGLMGFISLISGVANYPTPAGERIVLTFVIGGCIALAASVYFLKLVGAPHVARASDVFSITVACLLSFIALNSVLYLIAGVVGTLDAAIWESTAGITTTAASGLIPETLPSSVHIFRSLTQWLGGLGALCLVFVALPLSRKNAIDKDEASSGYSTEIFSRSPQQRIQELSTIYVAISTVFFFAYLLSGMGVFDAICHSMTTASTGGFSTKSASLGFYGSSAIEWVATFGMLFGGLNLGIYWWMWNRKFDEIRKNTELRFHLLIVLLAVAAFWSQFDWEIANLKDAAFVATSFSSTTGFTTGSWNFAPFMVAVAILLMAAGAMAGSPGGGYGAHRVIELVQYQRRETTRMHHPSAERKPKLSGHTLSDRNLEKLHGFTAAFVLLVGIGAFFLSVASQEMTFQEAVSLSLSSLVTNGPGLTETSSPLIEYNVVTHMTLSTLMVMGRLAIFPVAYVVLFGFTNLRMNLRGLLPIRGDE